LCLIILSAPRLLGAQDISQRYTETHGAQVTTVEYRVSRSAGEAAASSTSSPTGSAAGSASTDAVRWRQGVGTFDWQMTDAKAGTNLHGQRSGDVIHVSGTLRNKTVDRDVKVDSAPWYQVFGPLLEDLLPAGSSQQEFWVVNPDDLSAHKMQVRRAGTERITIRGASVDTNKIHFSPAGALAPFWGADFWYRQSDGAWVSSRLPENGGITVTTIEEPSQ
jgi:hypothetical protein